MSLALWQSGGRVTSVIQTLPPHVLDGILALFRTVYRIVQRFGPLPHLEGDAELVALNKGTITPSIHSRPSGVEILRFIAEPFRAAHGENVKNCQFFALASGSCTDRSSKKEELLYVRTVVDAMMATIFFSCQSLPFGTARGIVTALKRSMAHDVAELDVWIPKLVFYCGGATVVQGEHGGIIATLGDLQH